MTKNPTNFLRGAALGLLVFVSACNLQLKKNPAPTASTPLIPEGETAVPTVVPANADSQVEILSPQNGAEVPAGSPLTVAARWSGGDAIEASLSVDSQVTADQPGPIPTGQEIQLVWASPAAGKHSLTVQFLDEMKNPHEASMEILVSGPAESTTIAITATPAPGGAAISFLSLSADATLSAPVDSAGYAQAAVTLEAAGDSVKDIVLEADGLQVARAHNDS
jgi:hypothetical protein